jgi:hypothetical protein
MTRDAVDLHFVVELGGVQDLLRREQLGQRQAGAAFDDLLAGGQRQRAGAQARRAAGRGQDEVILRAVQRRDAQRRIRRGRIGEHLDLVELVDQVGPGLVLQIEPATRVRRVDVLRIGVAAGDVVGVGLAQALGGLRRADDAGFHLAPGREARRLLLAQDPEIAPELLNHAFGNGVAHGGLQR